MMCMKINDIFCFNKLIVLRNFNIAVKALKTGGSEAF